MCSLCHNRCFDFRIEKLDSFGLWQAGIQVAKKEVGTTGRFHYWELGQV